MKNWEEKYLLINNDLIFYLYTKNKNNNLYTLNIISIIEIILILILIVLLVIYSSFISPSLVLSSSYSLSLIPLKE